MSHRMTRPREGSMTFHRLLIRGSKLVYKEEGFPPRGGASRLQTTSLKIFTSHFPEPTTVWLKTPLSRLRSLRLGRGDFRYHLPCPPRVKRHLPLTLLFPPLMGRPA